MRKLERGTERERERERDQQERARDAKREKEREATAITSEERLIQWFANIIRGKYNIINAVYLNRTQHLEMYNSNDTL